MGSSLLVVEGFVIFLGVIKFMAYNTPRKVLVLKEENEERRQARDDGLAQKSSPYEGRTCRHEHLSHMVLNK